MKYRLSVIGDRISISAHSDGYTDLPLDSLLGSAKGVIAMTREFELQLLDATAPTGEISVKDLAALATALQELITRISRDVVQSPGPGRSKQYVEEFAQLRLSEIRGGSTVLQFVSGPTDTLDIDLTEQQLTDDRFWDVLTAIGADRKPPWVTDLVAESAMKLVNALTAAAPRAVFSSSAWGRIEIRSATVHVETWAPSVKQQEGVAQVHGRLEKVDLRSHEFRVRDDVGFSVDLKHVIDDADAARLVGRWVMAEGDATSNSEGRVVVLEHARVHEVVDPGAPYVGRYVVPVEEILESAPGPDPYGGIDLTDDEMAAFLRAIR